MQFFPKTRAFVLKHKRRLPTIALVAGLIWDYVTLGGPDRLYDNVVLLFYLALAGALIVFLNRRRQRTDEETSLWLLLLLQFSFGNLTSGLFVLYGTSGTIVGNWPFLLLLAGFLVGNEFLRGHYERMRFHVGVYYLLLFSYLILIVPVLLKDMSAYVFLLSGVLSLAAIAVFLFVVRLFAPRLAGENRKQLITVISIIFVSINGLYFLNLIPPVPLSLKDIGIYHSVERVASGNYQVVYEKGEWYEFWKRSDRIFHYFQGESAYCLSSVFAPAGLAIPIYHRWEYYDERDNAWQTATRITFPIVGGREKGYRGFSVKYSLFPGRWRCNVETERGALIGRHSFEIVAGDVKPEFVSGIR